MAIIPPSEGLRTKAWKYFRYRNDLDHEELYHLEDDPLEEHNLAGKKEYESKLLEMRWRFEQKAAALEFKK